MKCKRCHREIINPKSVQHGYGPICWIKMQKSNVDVSCLKHLDGTDANGEPRTQNKSCVNCGKRITGTGVNIHDKLGGIDTLNFACNKTCAENFERGV